MTIPSLDANPTVKTLFALGAFVAAVWAADSHWASAADIARVERAVEANRLTGEIGFLELARRDAENRMLDSKAVNGRDRYRGQMEQFAREKMAKQRALDELSAPKK